MQEEILESFPKLWHEEYLTSLCEHSTKLYQVEWTNKIKVNDIVLIKMPNKPRPFWSLGKVTKLIYGDDNRVRSAEVFHNGNTVLHSISHLYPMELSVTHSGTSQPDPKPPELNITPDLTSKPSTSRPVRKAAVKFRQFLQENLDDL